MKRRDFLKVAGLAPLLFQNVWARNNVSVPWSAVGDVAADGRAKLAVGGLGEGRLTVEWTTLLGTKLSGRVQGGISSKATDFTAQAALKDLPPNSMLHYKATVGDQVLHGRFQTAPTSIHRPVRLVWGGDVVGQGWGIDPSRGGMYTFRSMLNESPDFFLHCGDSIYADNPLSKAKGLDSGEVWHNIVIPEKVQPAKTLAQFQGNYRYNFLDKHYREFFAQVPVIAQWDDHEIQNNWSPAEHHELARRGYRAFRDYWPVRGEKNGRLYRNLSYGPLVEVFVLDLRSYRAPNGANDQPESGADTKMLGSEQLHWLKKSLKESKAVWKLIAGEMPLATYSPQWGLDNWTNGLTPPLGRELELAEILSYIKKEEINNIVWLSADVHYAMAIEFLPEKAAFKDFNPFWEFIAGPLHAGTFCPSEDLDPTFGPVEHFCSVPRDMRPNRPPSDELQFYGKVEAFADKLDVTIHQRRGKEIHRTTIQKK